MFDERTAGVSVGGRSVTMFGDALIIIKSLGVVCAGQIENNRILTSRRRYTGMESLFTFVNLAKASRLADSSFENTPALDKMSKFKRFWSRDQHLQIFSRWTRLSSNPLAFPPKSIRIFGRLRQYLTSSTITEVQI